ncbi:uncharacterized protein LOC142574261 isoform X2 [Dermacentor variabilis]|uniref:uncharacterized protein LOC142574261 isoform X2 n=1 Tax=Dermacentor variabilis TaxID=34621 RepID=UPI003F5C22CC
MFRVDKYKAHVYRERTPCFSSTVQPIPSRCARAIAVGCGRHRRRRRVAAVHRSDMAMSFARIWIRHERKVPRSQSPVYVLRLDSPAHSSEERGDSEVHFAGWTQRFEGKIVIIFSIVAALLIGVAVGFAFGTNSKTKAPSGSREPLTEFTVAKTLTATRQQESQLETVAGATGNGGPENASVNWNTYSHLQDSTGTTVHSSTEVNRSSTVASQ